MRKGCVGRLDQTFEPKRRLGLGPRWSVRVEFQVSLLRANHSMGVPGGLIPKSDSWNHTQTPTRPRRRSSIATVTVFDPTGLVAAALFARASFGDIMGRIEAVEGSPRQPQPARGAHLGAKP